MLYVALLLFGYVGLIVPELRAWFARRVVRLGAVSAWAFSWPAGLWAGALVYSGWLGLPLLARAVAYGVYLAAPVALLVTRRSTRPELDSSTQTSESARSRPGAARVVAAMAILLVPAALHLLPRLPVPDAAGTDVSKYLGIGAAAWCFAVLRPTPGMGFDVRLSRRSVGTAIAAVAAYAAIAIPAGHATGFLLWTPRVDARRLLIMPVLLMVTTALAEELVFRGIVQRSIEVGMAETRRGRWVALAVASVLFGLAHLPDPRYVVLATLAGAAYGLVYQRTGQLLAPVLAHALVDWLWALFLRG